MDTVTAAADLSDLDSLDGALDRAFDKAVSVDDAAHRWCRYQQSYGKYLFSCLLSKTLLFIVEF